MMCADRPRVIPNDALAALLARNSLQKIADLWVDRAKAPADAARVHRRGHLSRPNNASQFHTMAEAARVLRKSRRWLQDWIRDHPTDRHAEPFYTPLGRTKLFTDNDIERIRDTLKEEERCRLN